MEIPTRSLDELFAVCQFLADLPCRWWLGGGWAIDAWLGAHSRDHEDIEICVARSDQEQIFAYCSTWAFFTPVNDQWAPLPAGERLRPPQFMLQLQQTAATRVPIAQLPPTFEFLLNEVQADLWSFARAPQLQLPLAEVVGRSPWGMSVTRPELLLLHKAVYLPRPKDQHDFALILPHLSPAQRRWLREQIGVIHPAHPWLAALATDVV